MAPPYSSGYRKVPARGCRGRGPTPVAGEPAGQPRGKERGGARQRAGLRETRKPGVVRARVQTPEPPLRLPADPAVARPAPGRAALPARQRRPPPAPGRHTAQAPGGETPETRAVAPVHRRVPKAPLRGPREPDPASASRRPPGAARQTGWASIHVRICLSMPRCGGFRVEPPAKNRADSEKIADHGKNLLPGEIDRKWRGMTLPPVFIENTSRRRRMATRCDGSGHPG